MKKPASLKRNKRLCVYASEAQSGYSDGYKYKWPREVYVHSDDGFNLKQTKKLIKWLEKAVQWMES